MGSMRVSVEPWVNVLLSVLSRGRYQRADVLPERIKLAVANGG